MVSTLSGNALTIIDAASLSQVTPPAHIYITLVAQAHTRLQGNTGFLGGYENRFEGLLCR